MVIYKPGGRALEYAPLALNIYNGCSHKCKYCYCAKMRTPESFHSGAQPKKDIIKKVEKDVAALRKQFKGNNPEILLSFSGDVYQPAEEELHLTRQVLEILMDAELHFTILTKGGPLAQNDFKLLAGYTKCSFGSTVIFTKQKDAAYWEPSAPSIKDRCKAIKKAHEMGIRTWVSLEPVIDPMQALKLVEVLHPIVRHWKVGKINYFPEYENLDWISFRESITVLFKKMGASYYIKHSLTKL